MRRLTHLIALLASLAATSACFAQDSAIAATPSAPKVHMLIEGLELHALRADTTTSKLSVYTSYEEAQQLEAEIVQMYREIRAAELSLIQRQTLERSLESTLTPLSERAKVDQALLTDSAKDAETVKDYQQELSVVLRETDSIVANANELLASFIKEPKSQESSKEAQEELTPEEIAAMATQSESAVEAAVTPEQLEQQQQQTEQQAALEQEQAALKEQVEKDLDEVEVNLEEALQEIEAAKKRVQAMTEKAIDNAEKEVLVKLAQQIQETETLVKEVVAEVKSLPAEQTEKAEEAIEALREALAAVLATDEAVPEVEEQKPTKQHTEQAVKDVESAQEAMQAAAEGMAAIEAIEAMLNSMHEGQLLSDDQSIAQQQSLGALANAGSGKWLDITDQMRGRNLGQKPIEVPAAQRPDLWKDRKELNVLQSARKVITSSDRGGDWIFLGDWYVLSRYDNAHRANRQKVYPPESILDLDARYLSEDGQPMRWEYESFSPPYMRPFGEQSWKIYYFYTELYFEEASEAWLAIGSDDRSDIWINDLPVWHSSNQHKNWNPVEGFRKVYFKQGRNKVLVRLENGQSGLGLSIYMRLDR